MPRRPLLALLLTGSACTGAIIGPSSNPDAAPTGGADADVCARATAKLTGVTPTVMLLVDRSGSMKKSFGSTRRWDALYSTLMDGSTGIVKRLEGQVRFGLAAYTSQNGSTNGGTCPMMEQIAPALDNHAAIDAMYAPLQPVEDTPTAESITAVQASLAQVSEPGPKIIVLATDGLPDSCAVPDPDGLDDAKAGSVTAAQTAHSAGIDTYIISVGPEVSQAHLQDMANAGVGLAIGGADHAPYYQALSPDQLVAAFDAIVGGVRSCTYALDGTVDLNHAADGVVTLDGATLGYGVGWQLKDPRTLELIGDACAQVMGGGDHQLSATFTCDGYAVD